jgi:putative two-component system protein, hydrogenase maturation factor HypX/HoxX
MNILLVSTAFNGLTQRVWSELRRAGHHVDQRVLPSEDDDALRAWVDALKPDVALCPFLKSRVPVNLEVPVIIIHPGLPGDAGPNSIDWAIHRGDSTWGAEAIDAHTVMDAGDVHAWTSFPLRENATKSSLYGDEITEAAVRVSLEAVARLEAGLPATPQANMQTLGEPRRAMRNADREIDFCTMNANQILRIIRMSDSQPGARVNLQGTTYRVYDAHLEDFLEADPGEIKATRHGAVLIGTQTRPVWVGMAKLDAAGQIKLPAAQVLPVNNIRERNLEPWQLVDGKTWRDLEVSKHDGITLIEARFYSGAMSVNRSQRLLEALRYAERDPHTQAIVLTGGRNFFSNGIDLNTIQNATRPDLEAWHSINAINAVAECITRSQKLIVTALSGNAGAGGVMVGLGADRVVARSGVILNPHYKGMGLYGSELWTYNLPRRVGQTTALHLTEALLPVLAEDALEMGLFDAILPRDWNTFQQALLEYTRALLPQRESLVNTRLTALEVAHKPLEAHLAAELGEMEKNMFEDKLGFHGKRAAFVLKIPQCSTPGALLKGHDQEKQLVAG